MSSGLQRFPRSSLLAIFLLFAARPALAQLTGGVRVTVRDQQSLAIAAADVMIKSISSDWALTNTTNAQGELLFPAVPAGRYLVSARFEGFVPAELQITVTSNAVTPADLRLAVAGVAESVEVSGVVQSVNPESTRTENLVARRDILRDPAADQADSMAMITNNTPGAYMLHDHLHSRGGHGVSWQVDGVPVASSAMAVVGSQFDPKDVETLEVNRGGLSTAVGDRPYGVFNVVPRSGFEGNRFGDLTATYGSFDLVNLHLAFGDHTGDQKFAYFASLAGNRTDFGLERVALPVLHDEASGFSAFTSIIYNRSPRDQVRVVGSVRDGHFQVPNTVAQDLIGIDDAERGTDGLFNVTWLHTSERGDVLTVAPYYHRNRQQYIGGATDPLVTSDDRTSNYMGGYATWAATRGKHTVRVGTDSFAEHDDSSFGLTETVDEMRSVTQHEVLWSNVVSLFAEDSFRATSKLTVNGGLRFEAFNGTINEHATSPRLGAAFAIPNVGVLRASYSRHYEHPPTSTISGPVLEFALSEGFGFLPVHGEHDDVWEVGFGVPIHGWTLDVDAYRNMVDNLLDHDVLGNSNLLLPLTIAHGRVRAFESTLRSPLLLHRLTVHYAFAYQIAEGRGAVTGGMTDFQPPPNDEYFYLDHDQRVTFNSGASLDLPRKFWVSANVLFGSGFLLGDGPDHLPAHTTGDVAVGKSLGDRLNLRLAVTNVTNTDYLTGFENSFAGTHWAAPRETSIQAVYKFNY
jgi:hypothetical protein